jgi:hypothetical protein
VTVKAVDASATSFSATGTATYTVAAVAGTAGSFSDQFTRPDAPALGNGWAAVGSGVLRVQGNEARNDAIRTLHMAVQPGYTGAQQSVSAAFSSSSNNGNPRFGVMVRYQGPGSYYACYRQAGSTGALRISRFSNGTEKVLKSVSIGNTTGRFTVACDASASVITLRLNGTIKATISDTMFSSGSVGMFMGYTTASGAAASHHADDFAATVQ